MAGVNEQNLLYGEDGDDILQGYSTGTPGAGQSHGSFYMDGGSGDDELHGGAGDDFMIGRAGNDSFYVQSAAEIFDFDSNEDTMFFQ